MKIAIDLRSLQSGSISGVENYTINLLERLLQLDKKNSYVLFYNARKSGQFPELNFINSETVRTRFPNKFLNLALMAGVISLENLIGKFDCLFMPNLSLFHCSAKAKLAITVHDLSPVVAPEFYNLKRRLWHKFLNYQKVFAQADLIFAVSEFTKNDLLKLYNLPEGKIKVVYPGVDKNFFNPDIDERNLRRVRNLYGLPGNFILFLNTVEPRKNLGNLLKAFEQADISDYLVVAGRPGWKYRKLFEQINNSPKSNRIKYLGYIKEEHKPALIKLARALIYPSFYEGFGFQPLEAMALGVPTIVARATALTEVVEDASILINPYRTKDLTRALELAVSDKTLRKDLIERGYKRSADFNWDITAQRVLNGLNSILYG